MEVKPIGIKGFQVSIFSTIEIQTFESHIVFSVTFHRNTSRSLEVMANQNQRKFSIEEVMRILADDSDAFEDIEEDSGQSSSDDREEEAVISGGEEESSEDEDDDQIDEQDDDDADHDGDDVSQADMMSKDGKEKWSHNPLKANLTKQPASNIMRVRPGPTAYAIRNTESISSTFELFVTRPMQRLILKWTNKEGRVVFGEEWVDVDEVELKCYFGLLILAGVYKGANEPISNLWNIESGRKIFSKSMARNRFTTLSRCVRFDDAYTRRQHRSPDKLSPIRELLEIWVDSLQSCYNPYENVTVDEQLVTFRGRCPFMQYIPSKPGKYGIKIWVMCDSTTHYVCNIQVYTGKEADQPRDVNQGQRVVLDLVKPIARSGRNVTCDNFFTSLSLARQLDSIQLTLLGTIRAHRRELPAELITAKGREQFSSLFGFQQSATLASYCPKKGRVVVLLNSMHYKKEIDDGQKKKPFMIVDYNKTKAGVDTMDQMARTYTTKRKTRRWPMVVFYNLLDISAINAYVIWIHANPEWKKSASHKRRLFLEKLGMELLEQHLAVMAEQQSRKRQQEEVRLPVSSVPAVTGKRGRCVLCPRSGDLKHCTKCSKCQKFLCKEHILCSRCGDED